MHPPIQVLYVEDEPEFAAAAAIHLERLESHLSVDTATTAREALATLDGPVDCVVSAYELAPQDGIELLEAVRETHPELPFILLAENGSEAVASRAISADVTDYLPKDTRSEQYELLADRITNAVEQARTSPRRRGERDRFELLFDELTQPTVEVEYVDGDPVAKRVNEAFEEQFGYEEVDIVGESIDDYIVPTDRQDEAARINQRVQAGGRLDSIEVRRKTTDGVRDFLLQNAVYSDGSGGFAIYTDVTDRRERSRHLDRQNSRFTALFEHLPEPTIAYRYEDGVPHVVRVNGQFRETFGYDASEAVGEHIDDLIVPPDRREEAERICHAVRTGAAVDERLRRQTADGTGVFQFRNIPLPEDDAIDGYGIYADVTAFTRYEHELERQNDLFKQAQDIADVGAWEYDVESGDLYWTDKVAQMHGVDADDTLTLAESIQFYHPADRPTLETALERAHTEGEPYDLTLRLLTTDGETRWVRTQGRPQPENGPVCRLRGTIQDITAQKQRENELQRYEAYLAYSPDLVVLLNDDLAVEYQSPSSSLYGWEPKRIEGDDPFAYIHPDDRPTVRAHLAELRADPEAISTAEFRVADAADEWRWIETRGLNLLDEDPINGIFGVLRDVTERKRNEQELRRERDRLDDFAELVSHDLRNPLNVAMGRLDLARAGGDGDDAREQLAAVSRALDRMDALIDDVLRLARQGKAVGETEPVPLDRIASECWRTVETTDAQLRVETAATVHADPGRLAAVLENLFRNAVEHATAGVTVTVGELATADGFYVADDGPGVPPDQRTVVFESGFSMSDAGTGVGLAIVKQVVEAHGWEVTVTESDEGGARFVISAVDIESSSTHD